MNKKEKIYQTSLELFVELGEQATSMKLVAQKAGCGIGTMYNYFASKEVLMKELFLESKARLLDYVFNDFDFEASVKQQFNTAWLRTIEFHLNHPLILKYTSMYAHKCNAENLEQGSSMGFEDKVLQIYERGKKEGVIKNENTYMLLISNIGSITQNVLQFPKMNKSQIQVIVQMAWDAIKS